MLVWLVFFVVVVVVGGCMCGEKQTKKYKDIYIYMLS